MFKRRGRIGFIEKLLFVYGGDIEALLRYIQRIKTFFIGVSIFPVTSSYLTIYKKKPEVIWIPNKKVTNF